MRGIDVEAARRSLGESVRAAAETSEPRALNQ